MIVTCEVYMGYQIEEIQPVAGIMADIWQKFGLTIAREAFVQILLEVKCVGEPAQEAGV